MFFQFDRLLLLQSGGNVAFHGNIGPDAKDLINYFEQQPSTPKIEKNENPSSYILRVLGSTGISSSDIMDASPHINDTKSNSTFNSATKESKPSLPSLKYDSN